MSISAPIFTPGTEPHRSRALLQPIVETARAVFVAAASSIFIYDRHADTLVFSAVAGAGSENLVGRSLRSDTGIAGWVLRSRQALRLDDLTGNPLFSVEAAESTVYIPTSMMAAPLLFEDECVGVLEVLDWTEGSRGALADLALLEVIANQAAAAVRLLAASQLQLDAYADPRGTQLCGQIIRGLSVVSGPQLRASLDMLAAIAQLLGADGTIPASDTDVDSTHHLEERTR
jgi:GAF domain-containing protein